MASGSSGDIKKIPLFANNVGALLNEMGITRYDPAIVDHLAEYVSGFVITILMNAVSDAKNARKPNIDIEDIRLAILAENQKNEDLLKEAAKRRNEPPLEPVPEGLPLPPKQVSVVEPNVRQKRRYKARTSVIRTAPGTSQAPYPSGSRTSTGRAVDALIESTLSEEPEFVLPQRVEVVATEVPNINVRDIIILE